MPAPLISICLPNLNTRPFLDERMETILGQTFKDWELIICDSYSDDGAWEFFQKFKEDSRVRMCHVPREGLYAGWNECLRRAKGKYIYIATSDDTASPTALEKLIAPLERHPDVAVACCDFDPIDEHGKVLPPTKEPLHRFLGEWRNTPSIRNGKTEFLLHVCFCITWATMTAVLFRRNLLDRIGFFRTDRRSHADFEWAMRAALQSDLAYVPEKLATWRFHSAQATKHRYDWRFQRIQLDCIDAVLNDPAAGIPSTWKQIPDWEVQIKAIWEMEYLDGFFLYRAFATQHPSEFARYCLDALRLTPGHLLHQAVRGFPWSKECSPDRVAAAKHLIHLFNTPWPPRPLN